MLEYRLRRLPAARDAARALGASGARFPWESAADRARRHAAVGARSGRHRRADPDRVSSRSTSSPTSRGPRACYMDWTGDEAFAAGPGATSSSRRRATGRPASASSATAGAHLRRHRPGRVSRAGRRQRVHQRDGALEPAPGGRALAERLHGRRRARSLARCSPTRSSTATTPTRASTSSSPGFHRLEPLIIADVAPRRPIAADLLLGRDRVAASAGRQAGRRADAAPPRARRGRARTRSDRTCAYYEPRTAHGSSLSPGVHAALLARVRDDERALEALELAARIDLDDTTTTTAGGLHLATLGTVWQAFAFGFGGLRPTRDGALEIDPRLPTRWAGFEIRVRFRGSRIQLQKERGSCTVTASSPVMIRIGDVKCQVGPSGGTFIRHASRWEAS